MATKQEDVITVEDSRLIVNVAIDMKGQKSKSQKNDLHFTTKGPVRLHNGMTFSANLYS